MSNQPLFTPYRMGGLDLPNRILMAPLTRMRAHPHDHVPTALQETTTRNVLRPA
jgi:N-ethylmaleimide reductase